jgi:hypothetical protein
LDDDAGTYLFHQGELEGVCMVKLADSLQEFTHFLYRFKNWMVMICDLQGIYDDTALVPPCFELTDPAILLQIKTRKRNDVWLHRQGKSWHTNLF